MSLTIIAAGVGMSVQDLGRPGYAAIGVWRRSAGSSFGWRTRCDWPPPGPLPRCASPGRPVGTHVAFRVRAGATVSIERPRRGLRSYLAVRGGLVVDPLLGSASADVLSGIVPAPVAPGLVHPIGQQVEDAAPWPGQAPPLWRGEAELEVTPGPRADWLTREALRVLTASPWSVDANSNRIGVRLCGPNLDRSRRDELPSEPLVPGETVRLRMRG